MIRSLLLPFSFAFVAQAFGQPGALDPAFGKIPFDQWLGERDQTPFHWTAVARRAELSFHQRIVGGVEIKVDGRDLETRRGNGQLVFFVQISDRDGAHYQAHGGIELSKLDGNIKAADLDYLKRAFLLPGDFRLAVAILDTATGEHSTRQMQFRVAAPQHDLLPGAWRNLPPVEFIDNEESPDSWYLPDIHGRLQWAESVHSRTRINVILNVASSAPAPGSRRIHSGGELASLIPTLKAILQAGSPSISEHVELLDFARRRTVFEQDDVHDLDWPRLKASLAEATTASIDIHSLADRHHDAQFFVSSVRRRLRNSDTSCVLVVLTSPLAFESGEDLEPISLEGLAPCRVFYIRYQTPVQLLNPLGQQTVGRNRGSRIGGPVAPNRPRQDVIDELERTLKPLSPKVFDVSSPEQMGKALADILKALASS